FAARREGIGVAGIDLFFFGGFMKATRDSETPGEEFRVAAAGPAVTLLIAVVAAIIAAAMSSWQEMLDAAAGRGERQPGRGARELHGLDERRPARVQPDPRVPARRRPDRPRDRVG